ncbi:MAG: choice-of-anchor D domain-containing protein, partial [Candidatus Korobacteraceae bacterium]
APKADPSAIVLGFSGMDKLSKDSNGDLVAEVAGQPVRFAKPYAYQKVDGVARAVDSGYEMAADGKVHLRLGDYDRNRELIVDPVVGFATYLGGTGLDTGNGIAVDSSGNSYVTGQTCSADFATITTVSPNPTGYTYSSFNSICDAFVTEYNSTGSAYLYTTILGGTNPSGANASGNGIALDLSTANPAYTNQAYIVGTTNFFDLPGAPLYTNPPTVPNSYQPGGDSDAFIVILAADGTLVRTSYLGGYGAGSTAGNGIAIDYKNSVPPAVSVVGQTCSGNFPFYSAFETMVEQCVAFVTKLDNNLDIGSKVLPIGTAGHIDAEASAMSPAPASTATATYYFSEPYGGQPVAPLPTAIWTPGANYPAGAIVVDTTAGSGVQLALNSGTSTSLANYCPTCVPPVPDWTDTKLGANTIDGTISWEYLGPYTGTVAEEFSDAYGVAIDPQGGVFLAGGTNTASLLSTFWPCSGGGTGAWVLKVSSNHGGCTYEWTLENTPTSIKNNFTVDTATAIAVDSAGQSYVVGTASGTLGTSTNAYQPGNASTVAGGTNAFLVSVNQQGSSIRYATYLGGSGNDQGLGVAVDNNEEAYVTGSTTSQNFPVINPLVNPNDGYPLALSGAQGGFVTKFTSNGSALVFSSYLGGSGTDQSSAIAVSTDTVNPDFVDIYVAGNTTSLDFESTLLQQPMAAPNYAPPQATYGEAGDAFVAMIPGASIPTVTVSPGSLTFASQSVGTTSAPQAVVYFNTNTLSAVQITSISFASSVYAQAIGNGTPPDCGAGSVVQPNSTCQILVTFKPTSTQNPQNSQLTIADDASSTPHVVKLTGSGVLLPVATLSTLSVPFPDQALNVASAPIAITVTDTGSGPLQFSSIGFAGTNAGDFTQTNNCGSQLAAGSSCVIDVTFKPSALNGRTASLVLTDNAANSPQSVALSGTGISASGTIQLAFVAPSTGAFGTQQVGIASAAQTATLSNTSATTALTVNSIAVVPQVTGNTDFAIVPSTGAGVCSSTFPFVLAVNASCTIQVTFTPSTAVSESANLTVNGSASNSPVSLALSGTGTGGGSGGGPDFNISGASGESVVQGGTATYYLQVAPVTGYTGTITFNVTGLPKGSSWSVSPNPLNLNGATQTITLTVNTSGGNGSSARAVPPESGSRAIFLALLPFSMMGMLFMNKRRGIWLALVLVVLCLVLGMVGCGGGSSSGGLAVGGPYSFNLVATSSGGTEVENVPLQLMVNQQ